MSIDGVNRGGYVPITDTNPGASVASTGKSGGGAALDPKMAAEMHDALRKLLTDIERNPASSLPPPGKGDDKVDAGAVAANLGKLDADSVNADIYAFMALFQKLAQTMRDTSRMQRNTELQAQVSALQNAADQMRSAAALRFAGAVVQGSMQIAGGVAQIGFASASAASGVKAAGMPDKSVAQAQMSGTASTQYAASQASGSIAQGVGGIASAGLNYAADLKDAKKHELETQAKVHETAVQHANDMMQQMMEIIRDVRDKLQSIQQAAIETNKGIARNI